MEKQRSQNMASRGAVTGEIRSHTGLRGIAALLVVAYHQQFTQGYRLPIETATLLFKRSYLMVDLFFILSGFVLSYVYRDRVDVASFWRARFARIYPLHVFALLCLTAWTVTVWVLMVSTGHDAPDLGPFADWLRQLLLLNAWFSSEAGWNIPSWSISAEVFAYILFPVLAAIVTRRLIQIVAAVLILAFYLLIGPSLDIVFGLAPFRCMAGFTLGMLLFQYRETNVPALSTCQVLAAACAFLVLVFGLDDRLVVPPFAALVFLTWRDEGIVARVLSARPLHWLGNISYSVYLMHFTVGAVLSFAWFRLDTHAPIDPALSRILYLCLVFGSVLAVSHLTYKYIERPCQEALRRGKRVAAVAAP